MVGGMEANANAGTARFAILHFPVSSQRLSILIVKHLMERHILSVPRRGMRFFIASRLVIW